MTGFALDTIRMLYPEPWQITAGRRLGPGEHRAYLLMPNAADARLMMPAGPRKALVAAVRRHGTSGRASDRAKRLALTGLAASGAASAGWPSRVDVRSTNGAESIETWLERAIDAAGCRLAIRLGRPRANRKPVVQVLDGSGAVTAYVKVGHNALSSSLVTAEAAALDQLAHAGMRNVRVPRVLAHDEWNGLRLLALEPLPAAGVSVPTSAIRAAVTEIAASAPGRQTSWRDSSFRARLITEIASGGARLAPLQAVVSGLDDANPVMSFGAWHGDFNPGNFAAGKNDLLVWDWERYDRDVPVGFDLLHLTLQREITVRRRDPFAAARSLVGGAAALLGVSASAGARTAHAYLAWLACRYVRDDQDQAGARLGDVESWVFPALAGGR